MILHSEDPAFVTECVLTIVGLLYPLQYLFPIIPLLPTSMPTAENVSTIVYWSLVRKKYCKRVYSYVYIHDSTILYHTLPYSTTLYHTLPYSTILYHTLPYFTMLYCGFARCTFSAPHTRAVPTKTSFHCQLLLVYILA